MGSGTLRSMNNYSEIIHDLFGNSIEITGSRPVSGGDIRNGVRHLAGKTSQENDS